MERLTYKKDDGHYYTKDDCIIKIESINNNSSEVLYNCLDSLGHYEDLEEQGLLLKLPCKVGDSVFCIHMYNDRIGDVYLSHFQVRMYDDLGKTVFLTEDDAKEALQLLKRGEKI